MSFLREFRIESKEMQVSVSTHGLIKLSEWSTKSSNSIHMGKFGAVLMVNMTEKLMASGPATDFALKFNEARRGFLAQRSSNRGGRYVAVVEYGGGRRQGTVMVMVPEGKNGYGWQILNRVFREVVSYLKLQTGSSFYPGGGSRVRLEVSFAKVVKAPLIAAGEKSATIAVGNGVAGSVTNQKGKSIMAHADMVAKDASSNKNTVMVATGGNLRGELAADLSEVSGFDLWNQILALRNQVDRLANLMAIKAHRGPKDFKDLKCQVCGFHLQAQYKPDIGKGFSGPFHEWVAGPSASLRSGLGVDSSGLQSGPEGETMSAKGVIISVEGVKPAVMGTNLRVKRVVRLCRKIPQPSSSTLFQHWSCFLS
ncbi:hypothetical protein CJ030_MR3G019178 [Morella rubra]|uniref:Uncharacterized protein n=1 Tax=Morella rubra TaxID=262757 RepID=A0A6A1W3N9_9ROSI|nr:hypothetical protein CJ030_MR3G019178 [Morella rubra]